MFQLFASIALAMTFLLPIPTWAQTTQTANANVIGTIIESEGDNTILRAAENGNAVTAKADDPIYMDDVIQTGANGRALVMLIDESRFTLSENSRFKVDEYAYDDENTDDNKALYKILQGSFLYVSGFVAKKENPDVKISTPYGAIGIRGTTVWGGTLEEEYSVFVDDGEVTFETNRGRIRVAKGEGTVIRNANSIPERPKAWGQEKIKRATDTIALKNVERVKQRVEAQRTKNHELVVQHRQTIRSNRMNQIEQLKSRDNVRQRVIPTHPDQQPGNQNQNQQHMQKSEKQIENKAPDMIEVKPPATQPDKIREEIKGRIENHPEQREALKDNLPNDPAKRQEMIEKRQLQKAPANAGNNPGANPATPQQPKQRRNAL